MIVIHEGSCVFKVPTPSPGEPGHDGATMLGPGGGPPALTRAWLSLGRQP